jgi:uncharacterized protein (TIGR03492 family)
LILAIDSRRFKKNSRKQMKLLCLSNGHGEDGIALRILQQLQQQPNCPELSALPIVGEGHAYQRHGIPVVGQVKAMPSGGFIYMDGRQMVKDLRGGLAQLTWAQLQTVKAWGQAWGQSGGAILAVGDIVPLLFAWYSGAPYAFVGTAKSEYYLRDEQGVLPRPSWFEQLESAWGSVYLPWERWLMSRDRCRAVFPRDRLTREILQRWTIPAFDLGNPMMDGLEPTGMLDTLGLPPSQPSQRPTLTFALLPGSRVPEAERNWQTILAGMESLVQGLPDRELHFLGAIAPHLDLAPFTERTIAHGWEEIPAVSSGFPRSFRRRNATLFLIQSAFNDCIQQADMAIAMAGTATEQFVGLGKPALLLPGQGPQFTMAFAEAQTRLLGISAVLVHHPSQLAQTVRVLGADLARLKAIEQNGQRRMGQPGASARIAQALLDKLY